MQLSQLSQKIKCIVWDLDNVLWNGTLSEDNNVRLNQWIVDSIIELDKRGILHSISSKNNKKDAENKLKQFGIFDYFLYPQITWNTKSSSLKIINQNLNISFDSMIMIDDEQYELDEVRSALPEITCILPSQLPELINIIRQQTLCCTQEARERRLAYLSECKRNESREIFKGPEKDFLLSLNMNLTISLANETDLDRAQELTIRTHQLNTTGISYSHEQLQDFIQRDDYQVFILQLKDKYGGYGKIGLTVLHCQPDCWTICLMLMSCRVMSKGIGSTMIAYLINAAFKASKNDRLSGGPNDAPIKLLAEFNSHSRNRLMMITYRLMGFEILKEDGNHKLLISRAVPPVSYPDYINLQDKTGNWYG